VQSYRPIEIAGAFYLHSWAVSRPDDLEAVNQVDTIQPAFSVMV
jgi:hypothetical protein